MKKNLLSMVLIVFMILSTFQIAFGVEKEIDIYVNDEKITFDTSPVIRNDRMIVPLRAIFESLNAEVEWDDYTKTVTAYKGDNTIRIQIGNPTAILNDEVIELDTPAIIINSRTMVPLRFVSESLGADVTWDEKNWSVIIEYTETLPSDPPFYIPDYTTSPNPTSNPTPTTTPTSTPTPTPTLTPTPIENPQPPQIENSQNKTVEEVAKNAWSSVMIKTYYVISQSSVSDLGSGSGIIIGDGIIVTNSHVISNSNRLGIIYHNTQLEDEQRTSTVFLDDPERDIAFVKSPDPAYAPVKLGDSDALKLGQSVVTIGSPSGLLNSVSTGIVSGFREINGYKYLQMTAAISPGNSGGGLFNMDGELVGITVAKIVDGENLNLAIPINDVKPYLTAEREKEDVFNLELNKRLFEVMEEFTFENNTLFFNNFSYYGTKDGLYHVNYSLYEESEGANIIGDLMRNESFVAALNVEFEKVRGILSEYGISSFVISIKAGNDKFEYKSTNGVSEVITNSFLDENPDAPSNLTAFPISRSEIAVQWDQVAGADYYYLYYSSRPNGTYYPFENKNGAKFELQWYPNYSALLQSLFPGTTRYFKVTAVKNGVESDFSNVAYATTPFF